MPDDPIRVKTKDSRQVVDLTDEVNRRISRAGLEDGVCLLFLQHATAALTVGEIGEGTEQDLLEVLKEIVPKIRFRHAHDPSHAPAHMIASIIGPSLVLPVANGKLALGTWQSVLLVELDGPRDRTILLKVLK